MSARGSDAQKWVRGWQVGFSGPKWQALMQGLAGLLGDQNVADSEQAVREGVGGLGEDEIAAGLLGNDKQLDRGPSESVAAYRARLAYAVDLARLYGHPAGILIALYYADFPGAVLLQQNGLAWELSSAPNLAELRASPSALPSWIVKTVLPDQNPAIPATVDKPAIPALTIPWASIAPGPMDATGDQWNGRFIIAFPDGLPVDSDLATAANLARIRRVIRKWKAASRRCAGIYVTEAGEVWDAPTDRTWDDGGGAWWDVDTFTSYSAE